MKTSNKLLLSFLTVAIVLFVGVHLALYASYRHGNIRTESELDASRFNRFSLSTPGWLVLEGNLRVRIIPSDHFQIDLDKTGRALGYRKDGDTLIISGNKSRIKNPHGSWSDYWNLPLVNVYSPALKGIRVEDGYVSLTNRENFTGLAASLMLTDAQLWIGAFDPLKDTADKIEPFDSIRIDAKNSSIVVNRQSLVHKISVRLDDVSEITDRFSEIDTGWIDANRYSKIYMTAANFNKISVFLASDSVTGEATPRWKPRLMTPRQTIILGIKKIETTH